MEENKGKVLSVNAFAKRAGLNTRTVRYHIEKGRIATRKYTVEMLGIPEYELERLDEFVVRSDAQFKQK